MKQKNKGIILSFLLLIAIICIITVLMISIKIVNNSGKQIADMESKTEEILSAQTATNHWEFDATGDVQTFIVPKTGRYSFEVAGAGGASGKVNKGDNHSTVSTDGGFGSMLKGKIELTKGTKLYLYVGKKGEGKTGGWNGGGDGLGYGPIIEGYPNGKFNPMDYVEYGGTKKDPNPPSGFSAGGGGASDIRLGGQDLNNRIIVAPGGAGGGFSIYVAWDQNAGRTRCGGHPIGFDEDELGNGELGLGARAKSQDHSYAEDGAWQHRVTGSGGGGGGYEGGAVKHTTRQDSYGYSGTSYWNQDLTADVETITRATSMCKEVNKEIKSTSGDGFITITLEHEHTYEIISTTATCTQAGQTVERCTICGDEINRTGQALGHNPQTNYLYATNNNITNGLRYKNCTRCGIRLENAYLLSLKTGEGIASVSGGGYYAKGTSVTARANLTTGYTWKNWTGTYTSTNQNYTFNMPEKAVELTANANEPQYTVNHYLQDLNGTGYTLRETRTFNAPANTSVTPRINTYTGFISPPTQTVTVRGDSSTVVNYRYTRRTDLSYKVRYLEKGTNKQLKAEKTVGGQTFEREITSSSEVIQINGYNYDSVSAAKIKIGTGENIITIYYTKRTDLSYKVKYLEKGTNKQLKTEKTVGGQTFESQITSSSEVIQINGYNYDSVSPASIKIGTGENIITIYYTKRTDLSYKVRYLEKGTNKQIRAEKTVGGQTFESEITSSNEVVQIYGYNYDSVSAEKIKIGTGENIIIIYYTKKDTSVVVHHYIYDAETNQNTTVKLVEDQTIRGKVGDNYTTQKTNQYQTNYRCKNETPTNHEGIMTEEVIQVTYYYELIRPTIENSIEIRPTIEAGYIEETTNIPVLTREDGTVTYNIRYRANIKNYIGKAKIEIVAKIPENIDIQRSNLAGGTYNENTKTITWEEEITGINTTNPTTHNIEVTKQIGIVYRNQDVMKEIETEVKGTITTYYPQTHSSKQGQELVSKNATDKTKIKQEYKVNYKVQKVWEDNENQRKERPESISVTIIIMPQNKIIRKKLNEENNWSYEETDLPKYVRETGEKINYIVVENETNEGELEFYEEADVNKTETQTNEVTNYLYTITNTYKTLDTELETQLTKTGSEEITSSNDEVNYIINFKAEIGKYIGRGKIKIVDELPYEIDEEKSDLAGGTYNKEAKTITWEEELPHINTFNPKGEPTIQLGTIIRKDETNTYEINITKQIKVVYKNIDLTQEKMVNTVKGGIKLYHQDAQDETSKGAQTNINVNGKVIVKYVDKETNQEIVKRGTDEQGQTYRYEITGKVGTNYQTQQKEIENYDYMESTNNETGEIEEGTKEVIYYYTRSKAEVIVKYQNIEGKEIAEPIVIKGQVWDEYETEQKEIENYRIARTTGNTKGTMTKEPIEVIYTYEKIPAKVIVKYIGKIGEKEEILQTETIDGYVGEQYQTEQKEIENYKFIGSTENTKGTMTKEPIEVIYTYEKIPAKVIIKYIEKTEDGEIKIIETEEKDGYVGDEYEIDQKEIENYRFIEATENVKGIMTEEPIEVVYTYEKIPAKIIIKHLEKTEEGEKELLPEETIEGYAGDEYEAKRKEIDNYRKAEPEPENSKGKMTEEPIEIIYYYEKIPSKITVKYVDIDTQEEIKYKEENEEKNYGYEINGYVGEQYETEQKEILIYEFVKSTENTEGTMTEEPIEIIYYYRKKVYNFSINKTIEKIMLNGENVEVLDGKLAKIEMKTKEIKNANLIVSYNIKVANEGEIDGKVKVVEMIPKGYEIIDTKDIWKTNEEGNLETEIELSAGESKTIEIELKWNNKEENLGARTNTIKLGNTEGSKDYQDINSEDDNSEATLIISVKTGIVVNAIIIIMIISSLGICAYIIIRVINKKGPSIDRIRFLNK